MGMDDDRFERLMRDAAHTYHAPPEPPLDAMWLRIEGEHFEKSARVQRWVPARWMRSTVGIAASLLVGVGIGRYWSDHRAPSPAASAANGRMPFDAAASSARPSSIGPQGNGAPALYQATTTRYLDQTTALLAALPREARAGHADVQFIDQARELLSTTRLLLDSPAASDPKLRTLFDDLELVLAQIARLPAARDRAEMELIKEALEQRDLLPRLRSAVADTPISTDD